MRTPRRPSLSCALSILAWVFLSCVGVNAQKKSQYVCDEPEPENICNAANTCGSTSGTCTVDVTRSGTSSNVKPEIANATSNQLFCIKTGTTTIWKTRKKNTGFMISFGNDSPFEPEGSIKGGGKKPVTTVARTPGCYKYDVGAFISGAVYGMSGGSKPELVILP